MPGGLTPGLVAEHLLHPRVALVGVRVQLGDEARFAAAVVDEVTDPQVNYVTDALDPSELRLGAVRT